jgi:hypothetical protein
LAFLLSLFEWVGSGQRTIQETTLALALSLASLLPVAATLVPRFRRTLRGFVILGFGGVFLSTWLGFIVLAGGISSLLTTFVLTFAAMIFLGGGLVIFSNHA